MNKRQLIAAAARRSSLTQGQTREALEAILEVIAHALADGDHVTISGFGRFDVQQYAGRKLRRFDGAGTLRGGRPTGARLPLVETAATETEEERFMRHKRNFLLALIVLLATPLLACNPNVLNAWGDLLASARFIWDSIWTTPEAITTPSASCAPRACWRPTASRPWPT